MKSMTEESEPADQRTQIALTLAAFAGVPFGIFAYACAVPFGPVLIGWFVSIIADIGITAALCCFATRYYVGIGLTFAAGFAATICVANLVVQRTGPVEWWVPPVQFIVIFVIMGVVSLFGSLTTGWIKKPDS
jgi:hypothetical protein